MRWGVSLIGRWDKEVCFFLSVSPSSADEVKSLLLSVSPSSVDKVKNLPNRQMRWRSLFHFVCFSLISRWGEEVTSYVRMTWQASCQALDGPGPMAPGRNSMLFVQMKWPFSQINNILITLSIEPSRNWPFLKEEAGTRKLASKVHLKRYIRQTSTGRKLELRIWHLELKLTYSLQHWGCLSFQPRTWWDLFGFLTFPVLLPNSLVSFLA